MIDLGALGQLDAGSSGGCAEAVRRLGALAPWILRGDVLARAREDEDLLPELAPMDPHLPSAPGSAVLLFARRGGSPEAFVREAFGLPLCWVRGRPDAAELPASLRALASLVRESVGLPGYGLALDAHVFGDVLPDLSRWDVECGSGWAALAAALVLLECGGSPDPAVFATACWAPDEGPTVVAGGAELDAKLALARHLGGRILFVAAGDLARARAREMGGLEVRALGTGRTARAVLAPLLLELEVVPGGDRPLDERIAYYERTAARNQARALDYYVEHLVAELTAECRKRGVTDHQADTLPRRLVSFLSMSPEGALFVARTVQPEEMLLLYTKQSEPFLEGFVRALPGVQIVTEPLGSRIEERRVVERVRSWVRDAPWAVDATPGPKSASVSLALAFPEATYFYLEHDFRPGREGRRVGGERVTRLRPKAGS